MAMTNCDSCGKRKRDYNGVIFFDKIFMCNICMQKITLIYLYTNKIKLLCPTCSGDRKIKCDHCSLDGLIEELSKHGHE
jgi:hypothetical protein